MKADNLTARVDVVNLPVFKSTILQTGRFVDNLKAELDKRGLVENEYILNRIKKLVRDFEWHGVFCNGCEFENRNADENPCKDCARAKFDNYTPKEVNGNG